MDFDFLAYIGPDPTPAEQLAAIRNDLKSAGSIPWPGLSDLFACVIGLYGEIEKLRVQVESETAKLRELVDAQNDIIKVVAGYRSKRNVKTTTIENATMPGCDVIMSPGESAAKKGKRKR